LTSEPPPRSPTSSTLRKQRQYRAATEERHKATDNTHQPQQHQTTLICTYQKWYRYHISLKNTTAAAVALVSALWRRTWWGKRKAERDRTPPAHTCSSPLPSPPVAATTATTPLPAFTCSQEPSGVVTSDPWSQPNMQVKHQKYRQRVLDHDYVYLKCLSEHSNRGF